MRKAKRFSVLGVTTGFLLAGGCAMQEDLAADHLVDSAAPDFTLKNMDGKDVSLADYRGKVVLLAFWGAG